MHLGIESPENGENFTVLLKAARPEGPLPGCPPYGLDRIFRRHRQHVRARRKRRMAIAAVLVLMIPVLTMTDVVSALLKLIELKGSEEIGRVFKVADGNLKFNVLGDHTDEEIMEFGQQLLAEEGEVTDAIGFIVNGEPYWMIISRYTALGGVENVGRRSRDPACEITPAYRDFVLNDWDGYLARIEAGELDPVGSETVVLEGDSFRMQVWELDHPEYGTIRYFAGDVVTEEKSGQDD